MHYLSLKSSSFLSNHNEESLKKNSKTYSTDRLRTIAIAVVHLEIKENLKNNL